MSVFDSTEFQDVKILMLKGEKGDKGDGSYDDSEIRSLISDESINRGKADAALEMAKADKSELAVERERLDTIIDSLNGEYGESELWTGDIGYIGQSATLSDDVSNYEYLDIYSYYHGRLSINTISTQYGGYFIRSENLVDAASSANIQSCEINITISGTTVSIINSVTWQWNGTHGSDATCTKNTESSHETDGFSIFKIVGRKIMENTEVNDIRIGADGTVYPTAGDAVRGQVSALKEDLLEADIYDLRRDLNYYSANWNDITFTWDKVQNNCTVTGTATSITYNNIFISQNSLPKNIHAGDVLRVKYSSENVWLIFYDYSGGNLTLLKEVKRDAIIKIPDTCTGLIIRLWISKGTTVNETVQVRIYTNNSYMIESVDTASQDEIGKTDMQPIIQEMLDLYGYCKLGTGAFYINGTIRMPVGSTLEGSGEATQIYLMSGNGKAAILMKRYSTVRDLSVIGSYTDLTESDFGEQTGNRYGIQYYKGSSDEWTSAYCSILNVFIKNFTAAGIYQYGTGANVEQGLFVSDVHIKNCWCGIWIYSNSEFCRYSNVQITYCYIACINNGGNNSFNNCVFHAYTVGMKIDGTQNNAAHGMCSNSSFCHTGNNSGSAVTLSDIAHGYVFSACQYWYNSIDITNCGGIVFNGCEIGRSAPININGGNTVMFGNCVFMNDVSYPPSINITDNTKVKFTGCYGSVSGNEISA